MKKIYQLIQSRKCKKTADVAKGQLVTFNVLMFGVNILRSYNLFNCENEKVWQIWPMYYKLSDMSDRRWILQQ